MNKQYIFWRRALIAGIVAWPFFYLLVSFMVITTITDKSFSLLMYSMLFVPILSSICLAIGIYFQKNENSQMAVYILRIPFYYFFLVVGTTFFAPGW